MTRSQDFSMRRLLLTTTVALALSAPLGAQVTVSTGAPTDYLGPLGIDSQLGPIPTAIAQSFIAPAGTSYLQSFTFYFTNFINGGSLNLDASVYAFNGSQLVGPALFASALFLGTNSFADVPMTFGTPTAPLNILLAPNTTYALILSVLSGAVQTPDGSSVLVGASSTDSYADGGLFFSTDASAPLTFSAADYPPDAAFSAAFSSSAVVGTPEPATLMLVATGMAGVGGVVARRRRRVR
jgi:hypothetical protein